MALFDTTGFRLLEQGLDIVNKNRNVIQNNLANVDTPGFKCKYLYFSGVLKNNLTPPKAPDLKRSFICQATYMKTTIHSTSLTETTWTPTPNRRFM